MKKLVVIAVILVAFFSNAQPTVYERLRMQSYTFSLDTSTSVYYPHTAQTKPAYLENFTDAIFGTEVTRITGDVGEAIPNITPTENWRNVMRHGYNLRQAWNADESVLYLSTHFTEGGAYGNPLFLNGETYEVIKKANIFGGVSANDVRWHNTDPNLFVYVSDTEIGTINWNTLATSTLYTLPVGYTGRPFSVQVLPTCTPSLVNIFVRS